METPLPTPDPAYAAAAWTPEMLLYYVVGLDEVARGKPHKLPELVHPEHTARLVAAVRALLGSPHRGVPQETPPPPPPEPAVPARVTWMDQVRAVLADRPLTARGIAEALDQAPGAVYGKLGYYVGKRDLVVVDRVHRPFLKPLAVYGLPGVAYGG